MADRYYRRGHWVKKSGRKSKKGAGWLMMAVAAGAAWFAVQAAKSDPSASTQPATTQQIAPADVAPPEATTP